MILLGFDQLVMEEAQREKKEHKMHPLGGKSMPVSTQNDRKKELKNRAKKSGDPLLTKRVVKASHDNRIRDPQ